PPLRTLADDDPVRVRHARRRLGDDALSLVAVEVADVADEKRLLPDPEPFTERGHERVDRRELLDPDPRVNGGDPVGIDAAPVERLADGLGDRDDAMGEVPLAPRGREVHPSRGDDLPAGAPRRQDRDLERVGVVAVDDVEASDPARDGEDRPRVRATAPGDALDRESLLAEASLEAAPAWAEAKLPDAALLELAHEEADLVLSPSPDAAAVQV